MYQSALGSQVVLFPLVFSIAKTTHTVVRYTRHVYLDAGEDRGSSEA